MVVGEAPGADEERYGKPFVGPAGQTLRNFLAQVGIDPDEVFYTNICKIRPPANKLEKFFLDGGVPTEPVLEGLLELMQEIQSVKPNVIYAAGNYALWALTAKASWFDKTIKGERVRGFTGIQKWRGSILPCSLVEGFKVVPTYHPSYIMREGMADHGTYLADLTRIKEDSEFPELRWPEKEIVVAWQQPKVLVNYHQVIAEKEAPLWLPHDMNRDQLKDKLLSSPSRPSTLDIEYIGSKLLCVGMSVDNVNPIVIPTETLGDMFYMQSIVDNTKKFNAQNSMFDASILEWHFGIKIMRRVTFDTMIAANAANIELPKGLDYLVSIYTRQPYHKDMVDWKKIAKGAQPLSIMYAYNGIDVWTQDEVMQEQIKWELQDEGVRRTFDFMMAMLVPLWEMSKRGVRMDLELLKNISSTLDSEAAAAHFQLMFLVGASQPINVRSNQQVADLLFNKLGLPTGKMNATGPACDDKTLAGLQLQAKNDEQRQAITLIRQIRTAENLKSKFFDLEFDNDGRMRGSYDPTKTVTGRLASRKFHPTGKGTNAQNIPRDKRARRAFIADKGKVFGYADLEKAESLVVAHLTGDPRMLHDHAPGQNAHKNLGAALFGKAPEDLTDDEYYLSKKTRHAGNYMQGWKTFMTNVNQDAHKTGVSVTAAEAKRYIEAYRNLHPFLPKWWDQTKQALYRGRTLYNLVGRKRVFYGHTESILPEAVAFVPQSTVGDTLNIGLLNVEGVPCPYSVEAGVFDALIGEELRDCGYEGLMQIHDAIAFQCFERDVERVTGLIRRALSIPILNPRTYETFTIPVEIAVDLDPEHLKAMKSNWGDAKVIKPQLAHA